MFVVQSFKYGRSAMKADVSAIRFCLLEHKDELSGACEARLQEELGAVGETRSDN